MNPLPYLDIHAHRRSPNADAVRVDCLSQEELTQEINFQYTTAGIHPWWLEDYSKDEINSFKAHIVKMANAGKLWGIGESGIDRAYPEFLEEQLELFKWHFDLTEKYHLPLVIHNVRAGSDFLSIIKEKKPATAWIFHDYRGNEQLMRDLLRLHPKCYFSFGISIDNSPQIRELLPFVPLDHMFLETDDQKHLDIHDIYLRAAHHIGIDVDFLKSQMWMNFKNVKNLN